MSDLDTANTTAIAAFFKSTELHAGVIAALVSSLVSYLTRRSDIKLYEERLQDDRDHSNRVHVYQNITLTNFDLLSRAGDDVLRIATDCLSKLSVTGLKADEVVQQIQNSLSEIDKIEKQMSDQILLKARIVSDTYHKKIKEVWGDFYDGVTPELTSLSLEQSAKKIRATEIAISELKTVFADQLVRITKSSQPGKK